MERFVKKKNTFDTPWLIILIVKSCMVFRSADKITFGVKVYTKKDDNTFETP